MYFIILATDCEDKIQLRIDTRPFHREYLKNPPGNSVKVHMGGPTLATDTITMNGTMLVVEAHCLDDVRAFFDGDPYSKAGLFKSVEIRPWSWSLGNNIESETIGIAS